MVQVLSVCVEIPRPGLEPVRLGGERTDRTDLHGVAAEVADERLVGERGDLRVVAATGEVDQRVAGDLVGEAGATIAQDAALAVEQHEIADRDRLLEVTLLLDVATLARTVAERLILQRAFAALVAHRAVEWMVGEQQFDDALLQQLAPSRSAVSTTMPGATVIMHDGCNAGPRPVSTSTRHMRHMPTELIRSW